MNLAVDPHCRKPRYFKKIVTSLPNPSTTYHSLKYTSILIDVFDTGQRNFSRFPQDVYLGKKKNLCISLSFHFSLRRLAGENENGRRIENRTFSSYFLDDWKGEYDNFRVRFSSSFSRSGEGFSCDATFCWYVCIYMLVCVFAFDERVSIGFIFPFEDSVQWSWFSFFWCKEAEFQKTVFLMF